MRCLRKVPNKLHSLLPLVPLSTSADCGVAEGHALGRKPCQEAQCLLPHGALGTSFHGRHVNLGRHELPPNIAIPRSIKKHLPNKAKQSKEALGQILGSEGARTTSPRAPSQSFPRARLRTVSAKDGPLRTTVITVCRCPCAIRGGLEHPDGLWPRSEPLRSVVPLEWLRIWTFESTFGTLADATMEERPIPIKTTCLRGHHEGRQYRALSCKR